MWRSKKLWALTFATIVLAVLVTAGWSRAQAVSADAGKTYDSLKVFTEVLSVVQKNYVEEVDTKTLIYDALTGMLRALDPHSGFLTPEDFKEMQVDTKGEFGGLGIQISIKDKVLTVIAPIEDTPAWRAGIQAGDQIVKIEGESTADMSLQDAVNKMRGPKATTITITVYREGWKKPKDFPLTRDIIKVKSVSHKMLDDKIGYLKLKQFQERSGPDLEAAFKDLVDEKKAQALVLDMRNNPGGLLRSAVDVAGLFVPNDSLVVYTKDRAGNRVEYRTTDSPVSDKIPMVVLVNQGSASASEIVAGAMKDLNRAVILGVTTFGKASVQSIIPLSDGSGVRITTARYYTPKGVSIQNTGIVPDIEVKLQGKNGESEHAMMREKDLKGHLDNDQNKDANDDVKEEKPETKTNGKEGDEEEKSLFLSQVDEKDDNQLQRAVDLLKTWMIFKQMPTKADNAQIRP